MEQERAGRLRVSCSVLLTQSVHVCSVYSLSSATMSACCLERLTLNFSCATNENKFLNIVLMPFSAVSEIEVIGNRKCLFQSHF